MSRRLSRVVLALVLTLGLGLVAGCGKKNQPEPPPGSDPNFGKPYPRQLP